MVHFRAVIHGKNKQMAYYGDAERYANDAMREHVLLTHGKQKHIEACSMATGKASILFRDTNYSGRTENKSDEMGKNVTSA